MAREWFVRELSQACSDFRGCQNILIRGYPGSLGKFLDKWFKARSSDIPDNVVGIIQRLVEHHG